MHTLVLHLESWYIAKPCIFRTPSNCSSLIPPTSLCCILEAPPVLPSSKANPQLLPVTTFETSGLADRSLGLGNSDRFYNPTLHPIHPKNKTIGKRHCFAGNIPYLECYMIHPVYENPLSLACLSWDKHHPPHVMIRCKRHYPTAKKNAKRHTLGNGGHLRCWNVDRIHANTLNVSKCRYR